MKYAEVRDNFATLIKLIEEEVGIKGASKELDKKLVLVCQTFKIVFILSWFFFAVLQTAKLQ